MLADMIVIIVTSLKMRGETGCPDTRCDAPVMSQPLADAQSEGQWFTKLFACDDIAGVRGTYLLQGIVRILIDNE